MDTFHQVFGFVAAVCLGIVGLTVFFLIVGKLKDKTRGFDVIKTKGFVKDGKAINVHTSGGKSLLGVKFIGFTNDHTGKGGIPYQLTNMMVLETAKGARILIRSDSVKMIEEVEDAC